MNSILEFLQKAAPFLALAVSQGIVKTSGGVNVEQVLGDVNQIVQDSKLPDNVQILVGDVQHILQDLQASGFISGSGIAAVAAGLGEFDAFVKNIKSNQVGVIRSHASLFGVPVDYWAVPLGSDVYKFQTDGTTPPPANAQIPTTIDKTNGPNPAGENPPPNDSGTPTSTPAV